MADCKYCEIIEKKKNIVYEDDEMAVAVPEKTITKGHLIVIPKKHHKTFQKTEDEETAKLFLTASFAASSLFETMAAEGTNITMNTGSLIKEEGHFHIDVIARKSDDNLNLMWKPTQRPEEEMDSTKSKIKDRCDLIGLKKSKEVIDLDKKQIEKIGGKEEPGKTDIKEEKKDKKEDKKEEKPKDAKEEKKEKGEESYLVRQLRRMP